MKIDMPLNKKPKLNQKLKLSNYLRGYVCCNINGNEGVLHSPLISRTGASPSDAVKYHAQDTHFF